MPSLKSSPWVVSIGLAALPLLVGCEPSEELYVQGGRLPDARVQISVADRDSLVDSAGRTVRKRMVHVTWDVDPQALVRFRHQLELSWSIDGRVDLRRDLLAGSGSLDLLWTCTSTNWIDPGECTQAGAERARILAYLSPDRALLVAEGRAGPW